MIDLRFGLLNVKCFSNFSLPLPGCTIYCLHSLPIDFMWHRLFMDMLGNGWLGILPKSNCFSTITIPTPFWRKTLLDRLKELFYHFCEICARKVKSRKNLKTKFVHRKGRVNRRFSTDKWSCTNPLHLLELLSPLVGQRRTHLPESYPETYDPL